MKIALIRHGKTKGNIERRFTGVTDDRLHPEGVNEIRALVASGIYPQVKRVYTSPLKRCVETAALIYPRNEKIVVDDLHEINFGELEDLTYEEIIAKPGFENFRWDPVDMSFPGGDDMTSFKKRCAGAFESVIEKEIAYEKNSEENGDVALVIHGGVINALMLHLFDQKGDVVVGNGQGFILHYKDGEFSYTPLIVESIDGGLSSQLEKEIRKRNES